MNLHITPSFKIDRLCKTASVLLFSSPEHKVHENISIYFCRKCPEIKQVSINIQCFNITFIFIQIINNIFRNAPSESIFVAVAPFEFRIMTSGDQQRPLCYQLNVNLQKEINMSINPTTLKYYKQNPKIKF